MMPASTVADAVALAATKHNGAFDKGGAPYILHPLRVMLANKPLELAPVR
jgi:(p)ppGpp synthase/HD superfamily hydrolase